MVDAHKFRLTDLTSLGPPASRFGLLGFGVLLLRRNTFAGSTVAVVGCVVSLTGLAWAMTITPDGAVGDWIGMGPAIGDAIGDSSGDDANEDIVYGFITDDTATMGFRVDILNTDVTDPYASPTPTSTNTPVPPTPTPTPTPPPPTPTSTNTPVPPTPTNTPIGPTPTDTPVP